MTTVILPKGSRVLVTGVNGFIASHIADQLLQDDYLVLGSVRSKAKGEPLLGYFKDKYGEGKFEIVIVADLAWQGAFDEALRGTASIM